MTRLRRKLPKLSVWPRLKGVLEWAYDSRDSRDTEVLCAHHILTVALRTPTIPEKRKNKYDIKCTFSSTLSLLDCRKGQQAVRVSDLPEARADRAQLHRIHRLRVGHRAQALGHARRSPSLRHQIIDIFIFNDIFKGTRSRDCVAFMSYGLWPFFRYIC